MIHNQTVRLNSPRYKAVFLSVRELSESLKDVDTDHPQINYERRAWVIEYSFLLPLSPLKRTSLTTLPSALSSNIIRYKSQKLKLDTFSLPSN